VKALVAVSIGLILLVELLVIRAPERDVVLVAAGLIGVVALLGARWLMAREDRDDVDESQDRDPAESLRRWLARTQTMVAWSETTRSDWDKHLRPMLARQFELATGQRMSKDPRAFHATAELVFGAELWQWVDPDNVSRTGGSEPGPGRMVLDEVLRRLERV
jgi:hypothetical protein